MAMTGADLVVRVAANIEEFVKGMKDGAESVKKIEAATTDWSKQLSMVNSYLGIFGASLGATAIVSFVRDAIAGASAVATLSRATGLTTDELQRFGFVGEEFHISMEEIGRGVESLSDRLAHGDASATKAVNMLGLSVKGLIAMGPKEAFLTLSDAAGRVEDPMLKSALASDLFGAKLSKTLLPMLGDLRKAFDDVPKGALMSKETIDSADRFDAAISHAWTSMKAFTADFTTGAWKGLSIGLGFTSVEAARAAEGLDKVAESSQKSTDAAKPLITHAQMLQSWLKSLRTEGMEPLTVAEQQAIVMADAHGKSVAEIAQALGKTEATVKLYQASLKDLASTEAEERALTAKGLLEVSKLQHEYNSLRIEHGGTARDAQIAQVHQWADDLIAQNKRAGTDTIAFYDMVAKVSAEKLRGVDIDWADLSTHSRSSLQATADKATATFEYAISHSSEFSRGYIQHRREEADAAREALRDWASNFADTIDANKAKEQELMDLQAQAQQQAEDDATWAEMERARKAGVSMDITRANFDELGDFVGGAGVGIHKTHDTFQGVDKGALYGLLVEGFSLMNAVNILRSGMDWHDWKGERGPRVPGFASGVDDFAGGLAVVGERGPELVNLPPHSSVYPSGTGGSVTNITIHMNGSIKDLAQPLIHEITKQMHRGRQWPSA